MNINGGVELEETASDANDTISLAVSNAPFADELQAGNGCHRERVTVVGLKTLFPGEEEDLGAGRETETPKKR
ncbi:unnamed protein product [Brassica rapa subsp. trilocularis]